MITSMSRLCNIHVTLCHVASPQPNPWHHRHHPNKYDHMWAVLLNTTLAWTHVCPTHLLKSSLSSPSIVTLLYLVLSLICTLLFLPQHCHFPIPTPYLSSYLLHLVIWSLDFASPDSHLCNLLLICSLLLLYTAHPPTWMHCLASISSYISLSYCCIVLQFKY